MTAKNTFDDDLKFLEKSVKILARPETEQILREIKNNKDIKTKDLIKKLDIDEKVFFPIRKSLVVLGFIHRNVDDDRNVMYSISEFGKAVLKSYGSLKKTIENKKTG